MSTQINGKRLLNFNKSLNPYAAVHGMAWKKTLIDLGMSGASRVLEADSEASPPDGLDIMTKRQTHKKP
jgi:hypothetical protein